MYAWEIPFQKVVGEKRRDELKEVKTATILRTIFLGFMIFTERAAMFLTILTFVLLGNNMTANIVSTVTVRCMSGRSGYGTLEVYSGHSYHISWS